MAKKVIILYSTGGMGHKKAAIAVHKAFQDKAPDVDVETVDVLEYGNRIYNFLYKDFYVFLMSRARWLWGCLYYFSNSPLVDMMTRGIRAQSDMRSLPGLGSMLAKKAPDAIVATHFLLPSIAGILRKKKGLRSKMFTLVTDYGPHSCWLSDHVDRFFVGAEPVSLELVKRGIPAEKIDATGIPTEHSFLMKFDRDELRRTYGLDEKKKTIFLMSGGFGVGPIGKMLLSLNSCRTDIQVIAVCGHNKAVHENIKALKERLRYPLVLFGFTDKIAELMAVSDLMITKAGGISVTESMNSHLPMILFASIPGQETWNEHFLIASGAAEKARKIEDIPVIADRMLLSDDVYDSFKKNIDRIRKPRAAEEIVEIVLREIESQ